MPARFTIVCDLEKLSHCDATTVDILARLQLVAKRCGGDLHLRHAPRELHALLAFVGLDGVICCGDVDVEARRQSEQREQARGIEEERDARDPPI